MSPEKRLSLSAWLALAIQLAAGATMLLILRRGLQTNHALADRLIFVADHRLLWTCAWLPWTLAGPAILFFYSCFARAHFHELGISKWIVLGTTVLAVACDWTAQGIEVFLLPGLAAKAATATFLRLDRAAVLLTGGLANGLYTLAAALLIWPTRNCYTAWTVRSGWGVVLSGTWLSIATTANSTEGLFWSNGGLALCLIFWLAGTARTAGRRALTGQAIGLPGNRHTVNIRPCGRGAFD